MQKIFIKRIYAPAARTDGWRVLVDRLWPRGIAKAVARIDGWAKDVAPSTALRTWFAHDPKKWAAFQKKYRAELRNNPAVADLQKRIAKQKTITLLFGARDEEHAHAIVLKAFLKK